MAHYASRGQLHLSDTRDQAAEQAVQTWAALTEGRDIREVALIADASNQEIDRLNARAQHLRAQRGELGHPEIPLPGVHYGLREGDLIAFTAQHRPHGQPRVENGTRGQVSAIRDRGATVTLDGSQRRPTQHTIRQTLRRSLGLQLALDDPVVVVRYAGRNLISTSVRMRCSSWCPDPLIGGGR